MNKLFRLMFLMIALLCMPLLVFPELGGMAERIHPLVVMFVAAAAAAILWPSPEEGQKGQGL